MKMLSLLKTSLIPEIHCQDLFRCYRNADRKIYGSVHCLASRNAVEIDVAYNGFEIPDKFVVGYGLDYDQHYRNLPYVGVIESE